MSAKPTKRKAKNMSSKAKEDVIACLVQITSEDTETHGGDGTISLLALPRAFVQENSCWLHMNSQFKKTFSTSDNFPLHDMIIIFPVVDAKKHNVVGFTAIAFDEDELSDWDDRGTESEDDV